MGTSTELEGQSPRSAMEDVNSEVKPSSRNRKESRSRSGGNKDEKPSRKDRDSANPSRSNSDVSLQESASKVATARDNRPSSTRSSRQNLRRSLSSSVLHQRSKSVGLDPQSHRKSKRSLNSDLQSSNHGVNRPAAQVDQNRDPPPPAKQSEKDANAYDKKTTSIEQKRRRGGDLDLSSRPRSDDRKGTKKEGKRPNRLTRSVSASILARPQQDSFSRSSNGAGRDSRKNDSPKRSRSTERSRDSRRASPQRSSSKDRNRDSPSRERQSCLSTSSHRDKRSSSSMRSSRRNSDNSSSPRERPSSGLDELETTSSFGHSEEESCCKRTSSNDRIRDLPPRERQNCRSMSSHRDKRSSPSKHSRRRHSDSSLSPRERPSSSMDELETSSSCDNSTDESSDNRSSGKEGSQESRHSSSHRDKRASSTKRSRRRHSDNSLSPRERAPSSQTNLKGTSAHESTRSKKPPSKDRTRDSPQRDRPTGASNLDKRSSSVKRSRRRSSESALEEDNAASSKQDDLEITNPSGHSHQYATTDAGLSRRSRSVKRSSSDILSKEGDRTTKETTDEAGTVIPLDRRNSRSKTLKRSKSGSTERSSQSEKSKSSTGNEAATSSSEREKLKLSEEDRGDRRSRSLKRSKSDVLSGSRKAASEKDVAPRGSSRRDETMSSNRGSKSVDMDSSRSRRPKRVEAVSRNDRPDSKHEKSSRDDSQKVSNTYEKSARDGHRDSNSARTRSGSDASNNQRRTNRETGQYSEESQAASKSAQKSQRSRRSSKSTSQYIREDTERRPSEKKEGRRRSSRGSRSSRTSSTEAPSDSSDSDEHHRRSSRDKNARSSTVESNVRTRNATDNPGSCGTVTIDYEQARFEESSESEDSAAPPNQLSSSPDPELECEVAPEGRNKRTRTWARSKTARNDQEGTIRDTDGKAEARPRTDFEKNRGGGGATDSDGERDAHVPASPESDGDSSGNAMSDFYLDDSDDENPHERDLALEPCTRSAAAATATAEPATTSPGRDADGSPRLHACQTPALCDTAPVDQSASLATPDQCSEARERPTKATKDGGELSSKSDHGRRGSARQQRRPSERRGSFSSNGSRRRVSRGSLRRTLSDEINISGLADLAAEDDSTDFVSEWEKSADPVKVKKHVRFREDVANSNGVACGFLEAELELTEEDIETIWYTGQNYKDFRNFCIKETLSARENESYTSRFHTVWATCDTDSTSASWEDLMLAPHTKDAPNNAVMLAKARYRGFEREVFSPILVRYRKFAIKYVVRQYHSFLQSESSDDRADMLLREASEKCSEPFRRYARLIAEGDGLLVAAWDGTAQQSRRKLERTYSGLSVVSESYMVAGEAEDPADERKDLLQSLKSSGSCRHLMSQKKGFDNPAFERGHR